MYEEFVQGLLLQHCCLQSVEGWGGFVCEREREREGWVKGYV